MWRRWLACNHQLRPSALGGAAAAAAASASGPSYGGGHRVCSALPPPTTAAVFRLLSRALCAESAGKGGASPPPPPPSPSSSASSSSSSSAGEGDPISFAEAKDPISFAEAKRLMRLVNVEALKKKLGMEEKEVILYRELLEACQSIGLAKTPEEAVAFAAVLDQAGVVLLFRDKVYLHPDKVVDLVRRAVPIALMPDDDPLRDELKKLQVKKEEIDLLAHKQVRRILWTGLGLSVFQVGLFFRLTFWEFSWDVMEPIAFFTTTTSIVLGYAYFLFTSRDPSYQDLMKRLYLRRQKKLLKKYSFDVDRFVELQKKCRSPLDASTSIKNRVGVDLDLEDALR